MSWITNLSNTYDALKIQGSKRLLPISHSTQNAHIEVTINEQCNMVDATFVDRDSSETVIPVTVDSASRSSGSAPHPLCDKLQYVAGDYRTYVDSKNTAHHDDYMKQLKSWVDSEFSNIKVEIVYNYLLKGNLILDLIEFGKLELDENNKLKNNFNPDGIKMSPGKPSESFVRFRVQHIDIDDSSVWGDEQLFKDYNNFYTSTLKKTEFCYVSGENKIYSQKHPSKILYSGDKGKLISSNDSSIVTYRGRFDKVEDAVTISYEVSQKAHNALKWLIVNQGKRAGSKTYVLFGINNEKVLNILSNTVDLNEDFVNDEVEITHQYLQKDLMKALEGYKTNLDPKTKLVMMGLEAPTTGRVAIIFYREFYGRDGNELINRMKQWHTIGAWKHTYFNKEKIRKTYVGIPSLKDIAETAYLNYKSTSDVSSKIISNAVNRLIPCLTDGRNVPYDIVRNLVNKAMSPANYDTYEWYKVLGVTCSMYIKYLKENEMEEYTMEIKDTNDIAYNCGRLLAVAHEIERRALYEDAKKNDESGNKTELRTTNAMKFFTSFAAQPEYIWGKINKNLIVYEQKLGSKANYLVKLKIEISDKINPDEFKEVRNLGGLMILGFDTQRHHLFYKTKNKDENNKGLEGELI